MIAFTFSGSIFNPSLETTNPKYTSYFCRNVHFFRFISIFSSFNHCNTALICLKCFPLLFLKINMSTRYTTTNLPKNGFTTSFITHMNVLRELVNPNGITNHSNNQSLVLNVFSIHHPL